MVEGGKAERATEGERWKNRNKSEWEHRRGGSEKERGCRSDRVSVKDGWKG